LGNVSNITVSGSGGKWFASVQTEREVETPLPRPSAGARGLDLGIARFATLSDGTVLEPLNTFRKYETSLAKAQCRMKHMKRYSRNWCKANARVQKIHARIGNCRRDYLHNASTTLSQTTALLVIEDLNVRNMSASAKGTVEAPGRNVKAKSGLNKSILDQGWREFRRQLNYKMTWNGGTLLAVPPHNTSRTCPACGHVAAANRVTQAKFACVACGYANHADVVGAINILSRGMQMLRDEGQDTADASAGRENAARIACEVNGAVSRQQQEPAEVTMREMVHA
jgi:putative transposase